MRALSTADSIDMWCHREFTGVFPPLADSAPPLVVGDAGLAPPHGTVLRTMGRWREGELRSFQCAGGSVIAVGQCLAGEQEFTRDADRALATGRLLPLTQWTGSYLCLVVRPHELTAFADLAGQYPLYFRRRPGRTWIGSQPATVAAAAGGGCRPDLQTLATQVLCPDVPLLPQNRSVVADVEQLGSGQALRITTEGACTQWEYETLLPDTDASFATGAEALRTALEESVGRRAARAGALTADFSGGLDSTSLAFLALRHKAGPLPVFTYHRAGGDCDDVEHAHRFARLDQRLHLQDVAGTPETLPYQRMEGVRRTGEPDPAAVGTARTRLRLEHIARHGGDIHLGGEGGDALLSAPPCYLAGLVRLGGLRKLGRHSHVLARSRHVSPLEVMGRAAHLAHTSFATALHRTARLLEQPEATVPHWLDTVSWWLAPGPEIAWLTDSARKEVAKLARSRIPIPPDPASTQPDVHATRHQLRTSASAQRQLDHTAAPFGLWPQAPFLDNDVIRACLRLPAHLRADPPAFKPLLGAALSGAVPAPVLDRRTKGDYSGEDYQGIRLASTALREILDTSRLAGFGVIAPDVVATSLDRARMGLRAPFPALNRLLGVELWLRSTLWR
ncbi:asparagine synthase-related protein [Streptomyces apocyni]|uniref:asparagine synthase-related protein n=1 Tax=Streptomyces apocyni TaxID=2654677 RepID=UPI0012EAE71F|nr:asparagine synthase-related protein [Streptomyces apocyni]